MSKDGKFRLGIDMHDEQLRVAMGDPNRLALWAEQTGRGFIVLNTRHLIRALEWPAGIQLVQQVVSAYRDFRRTLPDAYREQVTATDHATGRQVTVETDVMLDETPSLDEIAALRKQLDDMEADVRADLGRRKAVRS
jgi:hypothetical protein